jgi:hypothetical protein
MPYDPPMQRSTKAQMTLGDLHRATPVAAALCAARPRRAGDPLLTGLQDPPAGAANFCNVAARFLSNAA